MKRFLFFVSVTVISVVAIPYFITYFYQSEARGEFFLPSVVYDNGQDHRIKVFNPETQEVEDIWFEDYIKGVVAAEMPALFNVEALKAQAVAARTYAIKRIDEDVLFDDNGFSDINVKYDIGQAYLETDELKERWGDNFNSYYKKISSAVNDTKGEIMVYNDEPIEAVFHSTSSGVTESSENVWSQELPYLISVESRQDENAPDFLDEKIFTVSEVATRLMDEFPDLILTNGLLIQQIQIIERTPAGYIKAIQIGNKNLTGKQVRETLGLRSANFTVTQKNDNLIFTTKGYGHGAGMSQYGANFMAEQGYSYKDILKYYYQGIEIKKMEMH